jgi:hypothetical protein
MKRFSRLVFLLSFLTGSILLSCTKEADNPVVLDRSSLTGTWMVYEPQKKNTYEVNFIIDNATSDGILIANFAAAGQNVQAIAYLSGTTLSLTNNELLSNGWIVNGSGTVSGTTRIAWPYTLHDGANLYTIQATFTKK